LEPRDVSQGTEMAQRTNQPCVLLVDDMLPIRKAFRAYLQHSGFDVVEAANGVEALLRVREAVPDIIVMDLSLPLMDGWEATRHLKADRRTAGIPIVALTGLACSGAEATQAGCDAFLTKPCPMSELVNEIRKVLEGGVARMGHPLESRPRRPSPRHGGAR
jgi:two-component system cell cycle response regulator DivK